MVKLFSVVLKNVKLISRSWVYLVLLLVLPTLLILSASLLLNSVDVKNVSIGVVDGPNKDKILEMLPESKVKLYETAEECQIDLKSHSLLVCVETPEDLKNSKIKINFDNSKLLASRYAKQYITKKVLEEQLEVFGITFDEVLEKMSNFNIKIDETKSQLDEAYSELEAQENKLREYEENFEDIGVRFDEIYNNALEFEPELEQSVNDFKEAKQFLGEDITQFKQNTQNLRDQIDTITTNLQPILSPQDYNNFVQDLNEFTTSLDLLENNLDRLNSRSYYDEPDKILTDYRDTLVVLGDAKSFIAEMKIILSEGKQLVADNKERIENIVSDVEKSSEELQEIRNKVTSTSKNEVIFQDAFKLEGDVSNLFFPLLLILIISFTSIILSNMFTIEQTHKKSYIRELITPSSSIVFFLATFIICLLVVLVQIIILMVIGEFIFDMFIFENFFYLFFVTTLLSSIFVLIGMSIGYLVRSRHKSILVSTFILLFFIILSDLLVPRQLTGWIIRFITGFNPFVLADKLLFNSMVFSETIRFAAFYVIALLFLFFFFFIFAFISKKIGIYRLMKE